MDVAVEDNIAEDFVSESSMDVAVEDNTDEDFVSESSMDVAVEDNIAEDFVSESSMDVAVEDNTDEDLTLKTYESAHSINAKGMKIHPEKEREIKHISMQLRTPSGLTSLEDIPAYKQNNIEIT